MSQPDLFPASSSSSTPDDASAPEDDAWAQLRERQRAYLELRYEQQRQAGLKRQAGERQG
jgi:hypothetical protein